MNPTDNAKIRVKLSKTDDSGTQQKVQTLGRKRESLGGKKRGIVKLQSYGFSYHAPAGSLGMVSTLRGDPSSAYVNNLEHPDHRPKDLTEGEVKWYAKFGQHTHFKDDGSVEIVEAGGAKIIMKDGKIYLVGEIFAGGSQADVFKEAAMRGSTDDDTEGNGADALVGNLATMVWVR